MLKGKDLRKVHPAGLEPATFWTATRCSNPLSYECNGRYCIMHLGPVKEFGGDVSNLEICLNCAC